MTLSSLFTKGVALAASGQCRRKSKKASNYARQAMSALRSAKSQKGEKKIDSMINGMSYLANSVLEVSDSITPIANMNMVSALLAENVRGLLRENQAELIQNIKGVPSKKNK
jgi:hypothetical protein